VKVKLNNYIYNIIIIINNGHVIIIMIMIIIIIMVRYVSLYVKLDVEFM